MPDQTSDRPSLLVDDVSVNIGGVHALSNVTLSASISEIVGIIGPNGAGKTTLFDVISGLRQPTSGKIVMNDKDITAKSPTWRARNGLRRTFQRQQMLGSLSVEDNLVAAQDWRGGGGGFLADLLALPSRRDREGTRRDRAREVVERCGLQDAAANPSGSAAIGVARMTELGRAVVDGASVLLLDEPTSGLDASETSEVDDVIRWVREESAVLLVEHNVQFVMDLCDRVVVLEAGRVIAEGTPSEVRSSELVRAAYLG